MPTPDPTPPLVPTTTSAAVHTLTPAAGGLRIPMRMVCYAMECYAMPSLLSLVAYSPEVDFHEPWHRRCVVLSMRACM